MQFRRKHDLSTPCYSELESDGPLPVHHVAEDQVQPVVLAELRVEVHASDVDSECKASE
jgi:hypothetical protein